MSKVKYLKCTHVQSCFTMFFFWCQAAAVSVSPVHRDLHTVLYIPPSKGRSRELLKFRDGQNHPGPENTPGVYIHKCDISV